MAKKNIVYHETIHGEETIIYTIEDENTGRNKYFILESVPEKYQSNPRTLERINAEIERYNAEKNKNARLTSLTTKQGEKRWFVEEPSSLIGALYCAHKVDKEIKRDQKIIDDINKDSKKGMIASKNHYKKASNKVKARAAAIGLAAALLVGSIAGITALGNRDNDNSRNNPAISTESTYESDWSSGINSSTKPQTPDTNINFEVKEELVHTDLDTLTYSTTQNSDGSKVIELADALNIADVCYDNLQYELENSNHSYDFDASKFSPEMYVGEAISENSLKVIEDFVNKYGCRGMLMIGPAAVAEANEVSKKLTGKEFVTDSKQLDDPVDAFMTCMYISVKNYEYCSSVVGAENVTPEMVYDCYLYGCGNVMKWLNNCMENGKYNGNYKPKSYSKDIMYYSECLEPYMDALQKGLTDGSHDKYWKDTYYNGLWKLPDWNEVESTAAEPGE